MSDAVRAAYVHAVADGSRSVFHWAIAFGAAALLIGLLMRGRRPVEVPNT
jgi:phosphate/sulfate permease